MKFLIAIFISFASPHSTEKSMLFIETHGEEKIVFSKLEDCMGHINYNFPAIYQFAIKSYAPKEIVIEQIGCYAVPAEDEGSRI
tara:strand:- start:1734 stop:1985 length:252 start_codon:yes stop_codon:yes gene_type:complete